MNGIHKMECSNFLLSVRLAKTRSIQGYVDNRAPGMYASGFSWDDERTETSLIQPLRELDFPLKVNDAPENDGRYVQVVDDWKVKQSNLLKR